MGMDQNTEQKMQSGLPETAPEAEQTAVSPQEQPAVTVAPESAKKPWYRNKRLVIPAAAVLLAAAALLAASQLMTVAGKVYSIHAKELSFLGQALTEEDFLELREKAPQCQVVWDVPFQGGVLPSNSLEVTVTSLNEEDIRMLEYVPGLQKVNGTQCRDYLLLAQLQERRPEVNVLYSVPIAGTVYAKDTQELELDSFTREDARRLPALLQLRKVEISNCEDYALLQQLQEEYPQWNLAYTVRVGRQTVAWDTPEIRTDNLSGEELGLALAGLPKLKKLDVVNPAADHRELFALREQYPEVELNWVVEFFGQTITEDATVVDFSGIPLDSCEEVEKLVACLPNLEKLLMNDCGIDNETMAQFRERQRENYKVVWTVYLGNICVVQTDITHFMPYQLGEGYFYDEEAVDLKYCEDIICMDLGHHFISNIDFVKYMPHLKYLILAHTKIKDISAIAECHELIYLEIDWTRVKDLTPLAGLTALEDLNLNMTQCDVTPILGMTWLKNLWVPFRSEEVQQQLIESLPNTNLELVQSNTKGWRHLPNYYAQRDILGMHYMNQ